MLVVARFLDGQLIKGQTTDFHPKCDFFHVRAKGLEQHQISPLQLKALFFVKALEGDPGHQDRKEFPDGGGVRPKVWIQFIDGEELAGWPVSFFSLTSHASGFYLVPTDHASNIEKAFVFHHSLKKTYEGAEAERAAEKYTRRQKNNGRTPERWGSFLASH